MAKSPSSVGSGLIQIDTSDLEKYVSKLGNASKATTPVVETSLNEVGDSVVSLVAVNLARQTGLGLEQIRGMMKVQRAKSGSLKYEVTVKGGLMESGPAAARKLEGGRESDDFGERQPETMVIIVSKEDELVCPDCEELAAAGPMPYEIAQEHIPKHPHCRCVIMPYAPKGRRLPVTMTTVSGTDPKRRTGGRRIDVDMTLRQIAQQVIDKTVTKIRIELK
jgi:hypothetical protein